MSFYFAPTFKRVLGTTPYILQEASVEKATHVESAQPQIGSVIEEETVFHDRKNLPALNVNLNAVKAKATADILDDLDRKTAKKKK